MSGVLSSDNLCHSWRHEEEDSHLPTGVKRPPLTRILNGQVHRICDTIDEEQVRELLYARDSNMNIQGFNKCEIQTLIDVSYL